MSVINFFKSFDKVFILHLKGSESRLKNINELIDVIGPSRVEIMEAITPDSNEYLSSICNVPIKSFPACFRCGVARCDDNNCNNILIKTQIACFQTHLNALKRAIDMGYEKVLVLEDDVYLHGYVKDLIVTENAVKVLAGSLLDDRPRLLKLGWAFNQQHKRKDKLTIISDDHSVMSNPAYAFNIAAAKSLHTELLKGVLHTADVIIHSKPIKGLLRQRIDPPLFSEESWSSGRIDSSIHPKEKHLEHLEIQLKKAGIDEEKALEEKIKEHKRRENTHIRHCQFIDSVELDVMGFEEVDYGTSGANYLHLFDPMIQSIIFNIQPMFIENVTLKDCNYSKLTPKGIEGLTLVINDILKFVTEKKIFEELVPKSAEEFINNVHRYTKSNISRLDSELKSYDCSVVNPQGLSKKFEILINNLNSNDCRVKSLDVFFANNIQGRIIGYAAYRFFIGLVNRYGVEYPKNKPKVSVITVTYDVNETLKKTIKSIMEQTFEDFELIILDGSPARSTVDLAATFVKSLPYNNISIKILHGKDGGIYDAMNKAAAISNGDFFIFMNAGDAFYAPDTLQLLMDNSSPEIDFVYGDTVLERGDKSILIPSESCLGHLPFGNLFSHQAVLIRSETQRNFSYDVSYKLVADHNFYFRAYLAGSKFKQVGFPVATVDDGGVSSDAIQRTLDRWMSVRGEWVSNKFEALSILDEFYLSLLKHESIPGGVQFYKDNITKYSSISINKN
jgi:glycosyltransferase involved in cell wall biosynthesis